jgi:hypothetical protein
MTTPSTAGWRKLELIGADTVTDDKGNAFYLIQVRTDKNHLGGITSRC